MGRETRPLRGKRGAVRLIRAAVDVITRRAIHESPLQEGMEDGMGAEVGAASHVFQGIIRRWRATDPARRTATTASPKKGRISPSGGNDVSPLKFLLFLQIFYIITGFC